MKVGAVGSGSSGLGLMWLRQIQEMTTKRLAGQKGLLGLDSSRKKEKKLNLENLLSLGNPLAKLEGSPSKGIETTGQAPQSIDFNSLSMKITALVKNESFDFSIFQLEGTKYILGPGSLEIQKYNLVQISGNRQLEEVQGVLEINQVGALVNGYA